MGGLAPLGKSLLELAVLDLATKVSHHFAEGGDKVLLATGFAPLIAGTMVPSIWEATRSDSLAGGVAQVGKGFLDAAQ